MVVSPQRPWGKKVLVSKPNQFVAFRWKGRPLTSSWPRSELQSRGSAKQGVPDCRPRRRDGSARVALGLLVMGVVVVEAAVAAAALP
jgi:hypothetical protein